MRRAYEIHTHQKVEHDLQKMISRQRMCRIRRCEGDREERQAPSHIRCCLPTRTGWQLSGTVRNSTEGPTPGNMGQCSVPCTQQSREVNTQEKKNKALWNEGELHMKCSLLSNNSLELEQYSGVRLFWRLFFGNYCLDAFLFLDTCNPCGTISTLV